VSEQVSSLKKDLSVPHLPGSEDDGLGLENASLKWNEVEEAKDLDKGKDSNTSLTTSTDDETNAALGREEDAVTETQSNNGETADHRFELSDISVRFPEGELSVITGPTASGKTAMLVCAWHLCVSP
jgi:hypothetical protein